ncbi:hypothetical protein IY972_06385 [Campylobacter volucris]|uniref:hypothetical protein n=1 Tax=Campylobacter volucris TaxID=1031542 RepID=UPI0018A0F83D|nr:hypothetical protein [Campylobacter volucris]MBF7060522.1 hypothetical protein [Campylobacter volucris]
MSTNYQSIEIYIIEDQEYIFEYDKSSIECLNDTVMHIRPLSQNDTQYEVTFKTFKNNKDEDNEFQKQIKYRNYPLHTKTYAAIRENEVKIIDENPFVKAEISYEVIKYITNLDEMAKSGIIENVEIKKINFQTLEQSHKLSH